MNEAEDTHWTEDEDRLEQYVLNRITPDERKSLENHLRTCETCRRAVREERVLAGGVRAFGREQLKARLKERVTPARSRQIPWQQLVGIAAILMVVVGVGIYNGWFASQHTTEPIIASSEEKAQEKGDRRALSADSKTHVQGEFKSQASRPAESPRPPSRSQNAAGNTRGYTHQDEFAANNPAPQVYVEKDVATKKEGAPSPATAAPSEAGRIVASPAEAAASMSQTLWVEGKVLPEISPGSSAEVANKVAAQRQTGLRAGALDKSVSALRDKAAHVQRVDGQTITLKQQPTAALPIAQQSKQLRGQGEKVQTKVERSGQSLDLTIYLDPLADEEQWRKASVQPVTDDSLVIDIANKRIGYHIPGGWNSNSSQKAKQQKQSNDSQ